MNKKYPILPCIETVIRIAAGNPRAPVMTGDPLTPTQAMEGFLTLVPGVVQQPGGRQLQESAG